MRKLLQSLYRRVMGNPVVLSSMLMSENSARARMSGSVTSLACSSQIFAASDSLWVSDEDLAVHIFDVFFYRSSKLSRLIVSNRCPRHRTPCG